MARKKSSGDKFLDCLVEALSKAQGYGKSKISLATDEYKRQVELHQELGLGLNDARTKSMANVLDALDQTKTSKLAKFQATANKISEFDARMAEAQNVKVPWFKDSPAVRMYHALRTIVEDDPRMKTASHNFVAEAEVAQRTILSMFRGVIDEFSKNWAGVRRGSVTDADIASEAMKPGSSSNKVAADIASAIKQAHDYAISEMNLHGVTLKRLPGELPFQPIAAKLTDNASFIQDMKANIDWTKTGAGRFVRPAERDDWLKAYFEAARTGNWEEIPRPFEFTGGQFARDFHNERMIQFKDGQSYAAMVAKYMDGGILQTTVHSINKLAHNLGLVKIFGPSPSHTVKVFRDMAEARAHSLTPVGKNAKAINNYLRRYDNIIDIALHHNAMDPESTLGLMVNGTSNLMTSAMLTQASFLSLPGDIATAVAARLSNNEPVARIMTGWLEAFARIKTTRRQALEMGHAASEFTSMNLINTRFGLGTQYGGVVTQYIADKTMRLNLMNRGFDAIRGADARMRAMSLYDARNASFASLPERRMLERNGINEADWKRTTEAMKAKVYSPADDINMFRPLDHFDTLGSELVHKWQRMFYNEGRRTVIENTMEARAILTRGTRPETFAGALVNSMARFHGYPVTFFLSMARTALAADTLQGSMKTVASYGLLSTMAAALGIQAKNYWQGKSFEKINTPEFWLKAGMSGGAFSMWGDFVTGGMRPDTATNTVKSIGGPLVAMIGDANDLFVGSAFQALDIGQHSGQWTLGKQGVDLVDFLRKYTIPETFFVAPILQRNILEPLQERMSPQTMKRRYKGQKGFAAEAGTPYKPGVGPGSRVPFPVFGGGG